VQNWEYLCALQLEVKVQRIGLPSASFSQLGRILELQFQEDCCTEIMGSVFNRRDPVLPLEFEVIRPPEVTEVENALLSFRQGDYSRIDLLADHIATTEQIIRKYHGENTLYSATAAIFTTIAKNPALLQKVSNENLQKYFNLYKSFLRSNTAALWKDLKIDQKGFLSIFHCHDDGSPPSPMNIAYNEASGIPDIVISAEEDYLQSGIALYLIAEGKFKKLYQGLLLDGKQ